MSELVVTSLNLVLELQLALLLYLGMGLFTLVVAGGAHLWHRRHDEPFPEWVELAAQELNSGSKKLWYRVRAQALAPVLTVVATLLFWPVPCWLKCARLLKERSLTRQRVEEVFKVRPQHLLERLTVYEIEARETVRDPMNAVPELPFGHLNEAWTQLKAGNQLGDEVWSFTATWTGDFGRPDLRRGYVIWRRGSAAGHVLTMCKALELDQPEVLPSRKAAGTEGQRIDLSLDKNSCGVWWNGWLFR